MDRDWDEVLHEGCALHFVDDRWWLVCVVGWMKSQCAVFIVQMSWATPERIAYRDDHTLIALDRHDLSKVIAHIKRSGQLQYDVWQRRMFEQFVGGQWRFAAWPLMATAKRTMGAQHNVTKDESQDERAQEVVAEELNVRRV